MTKAVIDFETYYDKETSVLTLGNANYAAAADAYIVAVTVGDDIQCGTIEEMGPYCEQLAKDPSIEPWAANSNFDQAFWEKYWPAFQKPWKCILDVGQFHQTPRNLAGMVKALTGRDMDKSARDEMRGVHYEDLPPAEQEAMQLYCANDVQEEYNLIMTTPPMSPVEERIALATRACNRRGVFIDLDLVDQDKTRLERLRFETFKQIPWHADAAPLSYPALTRYCNTHGIPVPRSTAKTDEECADLMSEHPVLNEVLSCMRRFRRSNTLLKKLEALKLRVTPEGILPLDLLYCGAPHTRRWSSKGFNVQNLDKEPLDVGHGEFVWSRNWVKPRPGKIFIIRDYAQIEPRCLNWLAGNEELLAAMRVGYSYYEAYARAAKNWKGAPGTIKEELGKKKYTLLKNECLGLGYGMGASKFADYARVDADSAKATVKAFRDANQKVVKFWRSLDNLIISAARDKARHLVMEMPSGDLLQHFSVRAKGNDGGYESFVVRSDFSHNSKQPRLWGGTLTENVTQRMARDVLADALVRLEDAGLTVAFTVHDEVILEVDEADKEDAAVEADRILQSPPAWAEGLPLAVEGDFADSYTK